MMDILHSYSNIANFGFKTKPRKQNKPNYILRDDLNHKKKSTNKLKKRDNYSVPAEAMPLLHGEKELERESHGHSLLSGKEREGIVKVKILMTKEEAARLLKKCKDGGVLEFKDVARELVQIPASRVSTVISSGKGEDRLVLGSIPEEY